MLSKIMLSKYLNIFIIGICDMYIEQKKILKLLAKLNEGINRQSSVKTLNKLQVNKFSFL